VKVGVVLGAVGWFWILLGMLCVHRPEIPPQVRRCGGGCQEGLCGVCLLSNQLWDTTHILTYSMHLSTTHTHTHTHTTHTCMRARACTRLRARTNQLFVSSLQAENMMRQKKRWGRFQCPMRISDKLLLEGLLFVSCVLHGA